jgi:effector-binding domain-containing protein
MSVSLRTVEASRTAVVRAPFDPMRIASLWDPVYAFVRGGQTDVRQTGQNVALYRRDGTMEVGVEVDRAFEQVDEVVASELPAGRVAAATHSTGYGDLHVTYADIKDWCEANDHVITGDTWEIYGDPDEDDQVEVEVYYLLA